MTPRMLLLQASKRLAGAGIPDPETDAALLLSHLLNRPPLLLRLDTESALAEETLVSFEAMLQRRLSREPLQYILGYVFFHGLRFQVDSRGLIPRPETALLVDWALERMAGLSAPTVLDLCCGSGCIGLAIKACRPDASVTLTDLSPDALALARQNADQLGLRAGFHCGDLFQPVRERRFSLILSNPPYIPTPDCAALQREVLSEPRIALDGGPDGLRFYRRIALEAPDHLLSGGQLFLEVGDQEADLVRPLLESSGAASVETRADLNGIARMIAAVYP